METRPLSDLIAALRKGDGNGCERSNWLMQEAADALMANQGAIVNSIIERTRHEATDDEREALIEQATWALIEWDTDTADRGVRDEHYRDRRADVERVFPILFRRSEVPEPSAEATNRGTFGHVWPCPLFYVGNWERGEEEYYPTAECSNPAVCERSEPQSEPSDDGHLITDCEHGVNSLYDQCAPCEALERSEVGGEGAMSGNRELIAEAREILKRPDGADLIFHDELVVRDITDALEAAEKELSTLRNVVKDYDTNFPCDGGCNTNDGPEETCSRHGRSPSDLWNLLDAARRAGSAR